jgi:hypothetical protein
MLRDGVVRVGDAARIGEILGTIHKRTAGIKEVAASFANDENFADLRLRPYLETAANNNSDVAPILLTLSERTANAKMALVHGDFSPKNILIGPTGPVILDAECAWYGDPAFDTSFCLNHLLLKCVWRPQYASAYLASAEAFWNAYIVATKSSADGVENRTATLLPGLMLARVDGKSPVEYLTEDSEKAKVRDFAKRHLLFPKDTIAGLVDEWQRYLQ